MYNQTDRYNKLLNLALVLGVLAAIVFILLSVVGYGKLSYTLGPNDQLSINGNSVKTNEVKLRPGSYEVVLKSPRYATVRETVNVNVFQTKQYKPNLDERNPDEIAGAAIGSYGFYGPPGMTQTEWFQNDTWIAGVVGPGSSALAAFEFREGRWQVGYFEAPRYPKDLQALPPDVAAYLSSITTENSPQ